MRRGVGGVHRHTTWALAVLAVGTLFGEATHGYVDTRRASARLGNRLARLALHFVLR